MARRHQFRRAVQAVGDAIGKAAFWVAPNFVGKRLAWKRALDYQARMAIREAGDTTDRFRGAKWLSSRLSPDSEAEQELEDVRKHARDLYLNDPIAAGYVRGRVSNIVGTGLTPQARIRASEDDGISEEDSKRLNDQVERLWERWAPKASKCGRRPFWSIQRLAQRCLDREGEALIVLSDKPLPGKPIPLCVEVVAVQRLETPAEFENEKYSNGSSKVRLGIERDQDGSPIAYWIRNADPDDTVDWRDNYDRVPAGRVIHLYDDEDPGQSRGWPNSVPAMASLKDVKDYDEAVLIKRQIEACFAVLIRGAGSPTDAAIAATTGINTNDQRLEEIVPGMVRYLGPVEGVETVNPGQGTGADHGAYLDARYHRIAAGLGYPFELLTKAYGGTNYSSGRLSLLDGRAEFRVAQKLLTDLLLVKVWERFVEEGILAGLIDVPVMDYLARPWLYTRSIWIPAGWPWVDPLKEVMADAEALDRGLASRTAINQGRGLDDEEVQEQRLREKMRDLDNEKRLREYRKSIGMEPAPQPPPPPAGQNGSQDGDDGDEGDNANGDGTSQDDSQNQDGNGKAVMKAFRQELLRAAVAEQ